MRRLIVVPILVAALMPVAVAHAAAPAATTEPARDITQTTATLPGTVDPNGEATTWHVEYGTSTSYGLRTPERDAGSGNDPVDVSAAVTGLTSATAYHFRVVATNAAGVSLGTNRTLTTDSPARAPSASTGVVRDLASTSATFTASVNPHGRATTVSFEFGTSTGYGRRTPAQDVGAGSSSVAVRAAVASLRPDTTYHVRVVATNAAGTARGADRAFRTPRTSSLTVAVSPEPVPYGRGVVVTGTLSGAQATGRSVVLQQSPFPFAGEFRQVGLPQVTDARGRYRFTVGVLLLTTRLRVATLTGTTVTSAVVTSHNALRTGLRVHRLPDRRLRVFGSVRPAIPGGRISLHVRSPSGRWVPVRRTRPVATGANRSRYALRIRARRRPAVVRVVARPPDGAHARGTSRELRLGGRPRGRR